MDTAQVIATLLTGALFGHELATLFVHVTLFRLPAADHLAAEQKINGLLTRIMPVFMVATVVAVAAAAIVGDGTLRRFDLAALGAVAAMLGVTFVGNIPINVRTMRLGPDVDPTDWRSMRTRWNRFHMVRIALLAVAFTLVTVAGR